MLVLDVCECGESESESASTKVATFICFCFNAIFSCHQWCVVRTMLKLEAFRGSSSNARSRTNSRRDSATVHEYEIVSVMDE